MVFWPHNFFVKWQIACISKRPFPFFTMKMFDAVMVHNVGIKTSLDRESSATSVTTYFNYLVWLALCSVDPFSSIYTFVHVSKLNLFSWLIIVCGSSADIVKNILWCKQCIGTLLVVDFTVSESTGNVERLEGIFCWVSLSHSLSSPGGRLNKKDGLTRYGDSHVKDKTS